MIDEIHIKPFHDYKGGNTIGSAYNSAEVATSAFVFMVKSLLSHFKDVVHVMPVKTINALHVYSHKPYYRLPGKYRL